VHIGFTDQRINHQADIVYTDLKNRQFPVHVSTRVANLSGPEYYCEIKAPRHAYLCLAGRIIRFFVWEICNC
jgi:hypothetical protein